MDTGCDECILAISVHGDSLVFPQWSAWFKDKSASRWAEVLLHTDCPDCLILGHHLCPLHNWSHLGWNYYHLWRIPHLVSPPSVKLGLIDWIRSVTSRKSCRGPIGLLSERSLAGLKIDVLWDQIQSWSRSKAWYWATQVLDIHLLGVLLKRVSTECGVVSNTSCSSQLLLPAGQ